MADEPAVSDEAMVVLRAMVELQTAGLIDGYYRQDTVESEWHDENPHTHYIEFDSIITQAGYDAVQKDEPQ